MALKDPVVEYFVDSHGHDRWRLKARNGEILCQSEAYASEQMAQKGFAAVARDAPKALWKPKAVTMKEQNGEEVRNPQEEMP